jgi:hypothetical protein
MATSPNKDMSIGFEFRLESIELDLTGWLGTLFTRNVIRPMAKTVRSRMARTDDGNPQLALISHPEK